MEHFFTNNEDSGKSDYVDAQADLSLRLEHMAEGTFSDMNIGHCFLISSSFSYKIP